MLIPSMTKYAAIVVQFLYLRHYVCWIDCCELASCILIPYSIWLFNQNLWSYVFLLWLRVASFQVKYAGSEKNEYWKREFFTVNPGIVVFCNYASSFEPALSCYSSSTVWLVGTRHGIWLGDYTKIVVCRSITVNSISMSPTSLIFTILSYSETFYSYNFLYLYILFTNYM